MKIGFVRINFDKLFCPSLIDLPGIHLNYWKRSLDSWIADRLPNFRKVVSKKKKKQHWNTTEQSSSAIFSSLFCFHQLLHKVTSQKFCGEHWTILMGSHLQQVHFANPNLLQKQGWTPRPLVSTISTVVSMGSSAWLPKQRLPSLKWEHLQQWHAVLSQILGRCHLSIPTHIERHGMYWLVRTQTLLQFCRFKFSKYSFYLQSPSSSCP